MQAGWEGRLDLARACWVAKRRGGLPPPLRLLRWGGLTAVVAALVLAGSAAAGVSASGSGAGSATVASVLPVTVGAGGAPVAELYPGGDGDVTVQISNRNPFPVHVATLALDRSQGDAGFEASLPGCDAADALTYTPQTNGGTGWDVPRNGTLDLDLAGALHMTTTASNMCQGATFTVYLRTAP
jgi:hypothetical protein